LALTPNLSTITIAGQYVDIEGNPIAGQVKFTPRATLKDTAADQIIVARTVFATLDTNGAFSVTIPATDDTSVDPINFTYLVEEAFTGGRTFDITVPAAGGTINLADVVPSVSSTGTEVATYVLLASYGPVKAQADAMEAVIDIIETAVEDIADGYATLATVEAQAISPLLLLGV
jgi:flagellin-like hook-associated protein FlgL